MSYKKGIGAEVMNILSIDVAITKPTAYALFLDNELQLYNKKPSIIKIEAIVKTTLPLDLIVTEDMYHDKNIDTLKKLCYEVGKAIYIAELYQIKYRLVRPYDWEGHHGLLYKRSSYIKILKKQIILNVTGKEIEDDDIQDAILIGLYVIERARLGME